MEIRRRDEEGEGEEEGEGHPWSVHIYLREKKGGRRGRHEVGERHHGDGIVW